MTNHFLKKEAKDTFFCEKRTLNCNGRLLLLDEPLVMGILNATPDSFYEKSRFSSEKQLLLQVEKMLSEGADIIDAGGYSTRPGAKNISEKEELQRLIPAIKIILKKFPRIIISADTFRSEVAKAAVENGASIINDISGGTSDKKMFETVAKLGVPYILMHIQGTPQTMQNNPQYKNVTKEILFFFAEKTKQLKELGVKDIILDPGFGFGKTLEHNYEILKNLNDFKIFELPILAGFSRKSMINKVLHTKPENALNGTTVLNTMALMKGAKILRVHDVKEAKEAVKIWKMVNG